MSPRHEHTHRRLRRALIVGGVLVAVSSAGALAFGSRRIVAEDAAYRAPAGPRCVPSQLNRSDVLPGTSLAVNPLPDSYDASPRTQISLLGFPVHALSDVSASGSSSGSHAGRLLAYSQGDGASFVPARAFAPGETVTVRGRVRSGTGRTTRFAYRFVVAHQDTLMYTPPAKPAKDYDEEQHFLSAPTIQPPVLSVTANADATTPGYIFTAPYSGPGPSGPEIFNDSGELVWFDPLAGETAATNLQVQSYDGQPVLTWWQGFIPPQGFGQGEEMIYSSSYQQVGRVHAGNGYKADLHDFHITPQGTALLTVFDPIACDLSSVGGPSGGAVTDSVLQELDLTTGLVRREWHSLDHVALSESYSSPVGVSTAWPFDFFHINSIDQLAGGETLISARNTWALYELNTITGQVTLRVGGKRSDVKPVNGAATAFQHDATVQPNGTVSVFDNGAVPKVHPQSRAIFVSVEPHARTDTLLARYEHPGGLSSGSQGSVQTLAGGGVFVGWGSEPYFSEFSPAGQLLYDAHWHGSYQSYRAYRFPWTGTPAQPPAIAVGGAASASAPVSVYASWNGATGVASWRVLAGSSPAQLAPVASAAKSGFETTIATPGPEPYVAVQALSSVGAVLGTSATIKS
ncbi:MAG TPA: arylsulfotransferase family protein [Solirubrobacteraceae bacterium]|nr:arylsulfotransferase family protein [Solirubrobacteraceae bacterium]